MADRMMNVTQVADYLGVKPSWLYDNYRAEGIPTYRVGRGLRFRQSDLDKWLDARKDVA
jgi:excisionase family DNA binding protein